MIDYTIELYDKENKLVDTLEEIQTDTEQEAVDIAKNQWKEKYTEEQHESFGRIRAWGGINFAR